MTFPNRRYVEIADYYNDYASCLADAVASVDRRRITDANKVIGRAYEEGRTVFVAGNGGSAAIASSFVCDHEKLIQTDTALRPILVSLVDNVPMITAISNDISYDDIFVYQLRIKCTDKDLLILISSSGNSPNVVKAAKWAKDNGVTIVGFTGFDGGKLAELSDVNIHVNSSNYGLVEDVHQGLMHATAQYLRQLHMDEHLIGQVKF